MRILVTGSNSYSDDNAVLVLFEQLVKESAGEVIEAFVERGPGVGDIAARLVLEGAGAEGVEVHLWHGEAVTIDKVYAFLQSDRDSRDANWWVEWARRVGIPCSVHYDTLSISG